MTTTILDVPAIRAQVHLWTVADFRALAEDNPAFAHAELIRGVILEKEMRTALHDYLTKALYDLFQRRVRAGWVVRHEATLLLADSAPEPDVAVVAGEEEDFRLDHPTTAAFVVEVVVTSLAADREKAALYAEAGVGEYWSVLAEAGQVEVCRQPEEGVYQDRRTYARSETIENIAVLGGTSLAVETLFA